MSIKTVCDVCDVVVRKVGEDYATVPVFYRGDPDLHTGRSEIEVIWEDVCVPCFEKTYTRGTQIPLASTNSTCDI